MGGAVGRKPQRGLLHEGMRESWALGRSVLRTTNSFCSGTSSVLGCSTFFRSTIDRHQRRYESLPRLVPHRLAARRGCAVLSSVKKRHRERCGVGMRLAALSRSNSPYVEI